MGKKVLADWLQDKYYINRKGDVKPKEPLFHIIRGEKKEVPESALWFQTYSQRDNADVIGSVVPTLLHGYCLQLAEEYKDIVKLNTATRQYHRWPWESNGTMHGYMTIVNSDGVFGDGEVHVKTVQASMVPYVCTIMTKRAEDRLILKALGLYAQGFYSQEEFPTDVDDVAVYSNNNISQEEVERNKKVALTNEVRTLTEEIKKNEPNFDPKVFMTTLLAIPDYTQATLEQWATVRDSMRKRLNPGV